jgi:nucleoside-diphosphate-sugar epimerase
MKVLLTGSAGFIGRHLLREFTTRADRLTRVDVREKDPMDADARDYFRTSDEHFDVVFHCAAIVGGRQLIETPLAHAANLEIDAALFQWAERMKPGRIVYVSSVAAYPVHLQQGPHRIFKDYDPVIPEHTLQEDDIRDYLPSFPDELYGWAKFMGEFMASRCSVPVSVPRPFTVYGEDQDEIFPFANIMKQVCERKDPVTVWGSGLQVRDFIHVDDVVNGMIAMTEQGIDGPVNFCTGRGTNLNQLIRMMTDAAGYSPAIEHLGKTEGLPYRVGDPAKLHEFYKPEITLEQGILKGLR